MVTWPGIRREPYRLLFPLGVLFGCVGVSHWLFYALHWSPASSSFFHASLQMGAYLYGFIAGFLMTALPRFASAAPASSAEFVAVLGLLGLQVLLLSVGWWVAAQACFAALLLALLLFAARRFAARQSPAGPPTEFLWIPLGALMGLAGSGLLSAGMLLPHAAWCSAVGNPMAQQGFVLAVVTGVAGFLAPRLMGREVLLVNPEGVSPEQARRVRQRRMALHGLAAAGLVISFLLEGLAQVRAAYLLRALIVTAELEWTAQLHRPPRPRELYVRLIWVSLWLTILGLWSAALWPRRRIALLHLVFLGGFSLMTFAVGTMVALAHAGEGERLRRPLGALRVAAAGVLIALVARVAADLIPAAFFPLLAVASASWLIGAVTWLIFLLPLAARVPPEGAFERLHEAATQRLRQPTPAPSN